VVDTGLADVNFPQMFTENRFAGGDRFGGTPTSSLDREPRRFLSSGDRQERLRRMIGQINLFSATSASGLRRLDAAQKTFATQRIFASLGGRTFRRLDFDHPRAVRSGATVRSALPGDAVFPGNRQGAQSEYRLNQDPPSDLTDRISGKGRCGGWYAVGRTINSGSDQAVGGRSRRP